MNADLPPTKRRGQNLPLVRLLPNLLTLAALCAGLTAIRFATQAEWHQAVGLVMLAALLDMLDGQLARLLRSESAIGAELDSLADFVSFGVAPALIFFFWLNATPGLIWLSVLIYAICCALRLARFNVGNIRTRSDGLEKRFFRGVPSPAGALLAFMPMYADFMLPDGPMFPHWILALYLIGIGGLMISRIPTWSFKSVTIRPDLVPVMLVGLVALAGAMLTWPWATLFGLGALYAATILVAGRFLRKPLGKPEV